MKKQYIGESFIQFSEECDEIVIDKLYVAKNQRGLKLGYELIKKALDFAESLNLNLSLYAESDEPNTISNEKLVEYYSDFGFESDSDCDQLMTYYT